MLYRQSTVKTLRKLRSNLKTSFDLKRPTRFLMVSKFYFSRYTLFVLILGSIQGCNMHSFRYEEAPFKCPTEHGEFIVINPNNIVGTNSPFCVAKYEMKNESGIAKSQSTGTVWTSISQNNARTACSALGTGYGLIKNEEWMTIAREIESIDQNWSGGTVNSGTLNIGWASHAGNFTNTTAAPTTDVNCLYNTGANTCGNSGLHLLKRTHSLDNGLIWDLSGNVWEWVDWNVLNNKAYRSSDGNPIGAFLEWTAIDSNINNTDPMPVNSWQANEATLTTANGIGTYYANLNGVGGAAGRGGSHNNGSNAGIYSLGFSYTPDTPLGHIGFRCVYRK